VTNFPTSDADATVKVFHLYVRHAGSQGAPWKEEYKEKTHDPEKFGRQLVEYFNGTVQPGERKREFVRVEVLGVAAAREDHEWHKQNLVTRFLRGMPVDYMQCGVCGITGKRWGLDRIKIDSEYRGLVYKRCDTSLAHRLSRGIKCP